MKNIQEQAAKLLRNQVEKGGSDPLDDARKNAACHILTHLLSSEGFVVLVASVHDGKMKGTALSGGVISPEDTMKVLLDLLRSTARNLGVITNECDCPDCRAARGEKTVH